MKREKTILAILLMVVLISSFVLADFGRLLVVEFSLTEDDAVDLKSLAVYEGKMGMDEVSSSEYSIVLLDKAGKILHTTNFEAVFEAWADPVDPETSFPFPQGGDGGIGKYGNVARESVDFILRVPFLEDAAKIQIRHNNAVLLEEEIDICNKDGTCQPARGENALSCPADCASGSADEYCDERFDKVCDPDCKAQGREDRDPDCMCGNGACDPREDFYTCSSDCKKKPANILMNYIIGAIAVVVVIVAIVVVLIVLGAKKGRQKKEPKQKK